MKNNEMTYEENQQMKMKQNYQAYCDNKKKFQDEVKDYKRIMLEDKPAYQMNFEEQQERMKDDHQRMLIVQANIMKQNIFQKLNIMEKQRLLSSQKAMKEYKFKIEIETNYQSKQKDEKRSSYKDEIIMHNQCDGNNLKNMVKKGGCLMVKYKDSECQYEIDEEEKRREEEELQKKIELEQKIENDTEEFTKQLKNLTQNNQDLYINFQNLKKKFDRLKDICDDQEQNHLFEQRQQKLELAIEQKKIDQENQRKAIQKLSTKVDFFEKKQRDQIEKEELKAFEIQQKEEIQQQEIANNNLAQLIDQLQQKNDREALYINKRIQYIIEDTDDKNIQQKLKSYMRQVKTNDSDTSSFQDILKQLSQYHNNQKNAFNNQAEVQSQYSDNEKINQQLNQQDQLKNQFIDLQENTEQLKETQSIIMDKDMYLMNFMQQNNENNQQVNIRIKPSRNQKQNQNIIQQYVQSQKNQYQDKIENENENKVQFKLDRVVSQQIKQEDDNEEKPRFQSQHQKNKNDKQQQIQNMLKKEKFKNIQNFNQLINHFYVQQYLEIKNIDPQLRLIYLKSIITFYLNLQSKFSKEQIQESLEAQQKNSIQLSQCKIIQFKDEKASNKTANLNQNSQNLINLLQNEHQSLQSHPFFKKKSNKQPLIMKSNCIQRLPILKQNIYNNL